MRFYELSTERMKKGHAWTNVAGIKELLVIYMSAIQLLSLNFFNILPQFYGFQPVDEVIRRSRTGVARSGNATGFNPWLFTKKYFFARRILILHNTQNPPGFSNQM